MKFTFDSRFSDSPLVDFIWRTTSEGGGFFTSVAESHWGIVVTRQKGRTYLTVRGPETKAVPAPIPEDAEFFGIAFKLGTFMPHLPARILVDGETNLPGASSKTFYMHGSSWQFPDFENADTFINKLVREDMLVHDPLVEQVIMGQPLDLTIRSVRRRFLQATGITHGMVFQIERARKALAMLEQGKSILDTVELAGYFDQSHLTRALKHFMGQTPAQIVRSLKTG
jgi:hypothetical protein